MKLNLDLRAGKKKLPRNVFAVFEDPIRSEIFSAAHLERHGESLAAAQHVLKDPSRGINLAGRVAENKIVLTAAYREVADAVKKKRAITPAAEWLLDNFHIIEEQLRDIRDHLPPGFYKELPKLSSGHLEGYPRVYGIAWAFVAHTDSLFDPELLKRFVRSYQRVQPLTIGELWAVSITLRVVMIENLRRLGARIVGSQTARKDADLFADELLGLGGEGSRSVEEILKGLSLEPLRGGFAVQLVQRLRFQESKVSLALKWLDERLAIEGLTADKIVPEEHNSQTAANATVRNIITSMRLISAFDWQVFFEEVSLVEEKLRQNAVYSSMDFNTRDRYRHGLEDLAKHSKVSEINVATAVVKKTQELRDQYIDKKFPIVERLVDTGYYLISKGRPAFEKELKFHLGIRRTILRFYVSHGVGIYLGGIFLLTALFVSYAIAPLSHLPVSNFLVYFFGVLSLFPASELAQTIINRLTVATLGPRQLPRLELKKGVPPHLKTFVVVPTMLIDEASIAAQVEQLEVHYLSNPAGELHFALLSDWKDAPTENLQDDFKLLEMALQKVEILNRKYGAAPSGEERFYVFHRRRQWNKQEGKWIGWERKRGKLHEFNQMLRGNTATSYIMPAGKPLTIPKNVRYVITLDADTKLPRGTVPQLVGTLAHPLNHAQFDVTLKRVTEGYGILQPRITASLPSTKDSTIFQQLSSGPAGIDPYASAVSDVYQDLFSEGSYTGKGIYDVDIFEKSLSGRIPQNRVLSHDLLEGCFARCGLLSDVELFEDFPSHCEVASARNHRWIRGDWQLLPWILGRCGKSISVIGRFKMADNLKRSLFQPLSLFVLIASFCFPWDYTYRFVWLITFSFLLPNLLPFLTGLTHYSKDISFGRQLASLLQDLNLGLGRFFTNLILLPHHSWIALDAIGRALFRLFFSKKKLLEWTTAAQSKSTASLNLSAFLKHMAGGEALTVCFVILIAHFHSIALRNVTPLLVFWISSPFWGRIISLPPDTDLAEPLENSEIILLRNTARKIWHFFSTFVTAEDHFLPPDNFQEDPVPTIAHRSSPTNFGLYLLSAIAARDFGWIGLHELVERLDATLTSMSELPKYEGHFYNWYETTTSRALEPRYISSVDNGNLAGHLLVVAQACEQYLNKPVFLSETFLGIGDSLRLLKKAVLERSEMKRSLTIGSAQVSAAVEDLESVVDLPFKTVSDKLEHWETLRAKAEVLLDTTKAYAEERGEGVTSEVLMWAKSIDQQIKSQLKDFRLLTPWMAYNLPRLTLSTPLRELSGKANDVIRQSLQNPDGLVLDSIVESLENSINACRGIEKKLFEIAQICRKLFQDMNFAMLYEPTRKLFSIGYRLTDNTLDASYYDLLASEARLLSFIAIAKGDVPAAHWFRLGRSLAPVERGAALISWSGSMFEYLMPSLVMHTPTGSLIDQTCRLVVQRQISYGNERSVPWGISESAYNTRDLQLTYQYSNFGVPDLGLKRGLGKDLVIAPYATILAAMYDASQASKNLHRLASLGGDGLYGFYEALDFTPERLPEGQNSALVKAYMAHHQGMSLVAIANVLQDGLMRTRFHLEPIVQATELLLQERTPRNVGVVTFKAEEIPVGNVAEENQVISRRYHSPSQSVPRTHLLASDQYSVMVTSAGSGYSRFRDLSVTRWREDVTRDQWGSFIYLRDVNSSEIWSAGFQPTCVEADRYEAVFNEDRARITRDDGTITSDLEIFLSPEDNAEIRRLTLTNNGTDLREIEITSYSELVLTQQGADLAHPAFSNLFVQTEFIHDIATLIATRRPRSKSENPIWMAHVIATDGHAVGGIEYETDRSRFIGRGRTPLNPISIFDGKPLSNTVGAVLDPVACLRTRVKLKPGASTHVTFSTVIGLSREETVNLADKFRDASTFDRASTLAWTQAQVKLHYLGIQHDEAALFQQLANRLIYLDSSLRVSSDMLKKNTRDVTGLWAHGISGDYPIVLVKIDDSEDRGIIRQLLRAHEYWGTKRLIVDLIIMNEKSSSYTQDLQESIEALVRGSAASSGSYLPQSKGKVFTLRSDLIPHQDRDLLQVAARAILVARQGSLAEQVKRTPRKTEAVLEYNRSISPRSQFDHSTLPTSPLEFFNGLGGFANKGREYIIYLKKGQSTPAPWINVIANKDFGFHVSEMGTSSTWSLNSRENQITPWSNDPVCDPSGEAFYIFDKDTGFLWSPTASPIRIESADYIAKHGQGYSQFEHLSHGIRSKLTQFVSWNEPVKISNLVLKNYSKVTRSLSITGYVEWVLGFSRTVTSPYIVTEQDETGQSILARNPWNAEFGSKIAFASFVGGHNSFTCDRAEFLGRNGNLNRPKMFFNTAPLTGRSGGGFDPCAVLQKNITLEPGEEISLTFLLGQAESKEKARSLVKKYQTANIEESLNEVILEWDKILCKVQVETPDPSMNLVLNRWLLYQTTVCRLFSRAAFYQAGGAYGFRDQLQDTMALIWAKPEMTREQILKASARQFVEGDVQHWWHLPSGRGVRTHFSDDLLWLPFVVSYYLKGTEDTSVLEEMIPFIEGALLKPEQEDSYFTPLTSSIKASVYEHCARTLDRSLKTGVHGLPLMGSGDWNDGMNRVGHEGKGESVWLAWFLYTNLMQFSEIAIERNDLQRADAWTSHAEKILQAIEREAWDGAWYRRAYFDDGTPLGSASNVECRIDSIAQTWGIISGAGNSDRVTRAMQSVEEFLIKPGDDLMLLFSPAFDKTNLDPGYIKGYLPGVRENGGQYSHAAVWCILAYAGLGNGKRAVELFSMLNPINHGLSRTGVHRYKVEPYVIAADVYSEPPYVGRGGWTWYTGSAGWMYRAGIESILGLQVRGNKLFIKPNINPDWDQYTIRYTHGSSLYEIKVINPKHVTSRIEKIEVDAKAIVKDGFIPLLDDKQEHKVLVTLG